MVARTLLAFLVVAAALALTLALVRDAARWPEAEVPPRQGEAVQRGSTPPQHLPEALRRLVREPQNTWSNLAFVLGGAALVVTARLRMARGVGVSLVAVGIGSFLYHASASRTLRHLDVGAMYWLFLLLAVLAQAASLRVSGAGVSLAPRRLPSAPRWPPWGSRWAAMSWCWG